MKKLSVYLSVALFTVGLLGSCEKNNVDPSLEEGKADVVLAVDMAPTASMGYVVPVKDLSTEKAEFADAHEVRSSPYLVSYKDWVFSVGGSADANIYKFIRNDDGTLSKAGEIQVDRTTPMVGHVLVVSDAKAYATAPVENKIVIFNPTTMERTGEIDLADSRWGVDGSKTPNPLGLFLRDDILYVGLGEFENMPVSKKGAHMLLIDAKTDKPIKKIMDERLSSATILGTGGMFVDDKNDLYVPCFGSFGYVPGHHSGLLRIKSGETEFDKSYCFNLTDRTWSDVEGGKLRYASSYYYAGNGELYFFGYCPAFMGPAGMDFIKDKTMYSFKANIYDCTAKTLDLPRTNAYSCAIGHKDDKVYFGLVTESQGAGLFVYDRRNGDCSQRPTMSVQGTIMSIVLF